MRVLVCGGRAYFNRDLIWSVLDHEHLTRKFSVVITGGADGADRLAKAWAESKGLPHIEMAANWRYYGRKGGPIRNSWMIRLAMPDLVIAFPGDTGTADMLDKARLAGIEPKVITDEGAGDENAS